MAETQQRYEETDDSGILLAEQARQISELRSTLLELRGARRSGGADEGKELGYRFDAGPKWLEGSGWKGQSPEHRKAWPVLRRLLELERWPGAPVRITYAQLADYLCCSEDTAKRRLRELAGQENTARLGEVVEFEPGSGRRPSIVRIKHPIATPLGYDEVPWAAGGLGEGTPEGYLEGLKGPKRRYAKLYGVKIPDQENEAPPEAPRPDQQPPPFFEGSPEDTSQHTGLIAAPGDAQRPPLETRDNCIMHSSDPSDGRARTTTQRRKREDRKETPAQRMEQNAKEIPVSEVSEGAIADARRICEALGRRDEITAHRAAQVAELLRRRAQVHLLPEVLRRVRHTISGGNHVHRPGAYLCATILDVEQNSLDPEGRGLAARVLAHPPQPTGLDSTGRRSMADIKRGYEWLFGE